MKNGKKWLHISLWANVALLVGIPVLGYAYLSNLVRNDIRYGSCRSSELGISALSLLLKSALEGDDRSRAVEMLKKEASKPENNSMKLEIGEGAASLGRIRIVFAGGKVKDVEMLEAKYVCPR